MTDKLTIAAADVLAERARQIGVEGWTTDHDDEHSKGEMAQAAACYADPAPARYADTRINEPIRWPPAWVRWWKPSKDHRGQPDRRRDLVKAGALILAEIERLDRAASRVEPGPAGCELVDGFMGTTCKTCGGDDFGGTFRCQTSGKPSDAASVTEGGEA